MQHIINYFVLQTSMYTDELKAKEFDPIRYL